MSHPDSEWDIPEEFASLMVAQCECAKHNLDVWTRRKPWEYGSTDSWLYVTGSTKLALMFLEALGDREEEKALLAKMSPEFLVQFTPGGGVCDEIMSKYDPDPGD